MNQIIKEIQKLNKDISLCVKCGLCQAVCPLFLEKRSEKTFARGKIVLIEGLANNILKNPKKLKENLDFCLFCSACARRCPNNVKTVEIFYRVRIILNLYLTLPFIEKKFLNIFLSYPRLFNFIFRFQNFFSKRQIKISSAPKAMQSASFIKDKKVKVLFFPGCLFNKFFFQVIKSSYEVFDKLDISYFVVEENICCGSAALGIGDYEMFCNNVNQNLALFNKVQFDYLVSPCSSCVYFIKKFWQMAKSSKIKEIQEKTMDINSFLIDIVKIKEVGGKQKKKIKITYHDPCHLKHGLGVFDAPRNLIKKNLDCDFIEMENSDSCCGGGGLFHMKNPKIAKNITDKKINNIKETSCDILATSCPLCMMRISSKLDNENKIMKIKHPIEIFGESLAR